MNEVEAPVEEFVDPVFGWRYTALRTAKYTEDQSLALALDRDVDLHRAVELARDAGPELAWAILS